MQVATGVAYQAGYIFQVKILLYECVVATDNKMILKLIFLDFVGSSLRFSGFSVLRVNYFPALSTRRSEFLVGEKRKENKGSVQ